MFAKNNLFLVICLTLMISCTNEKNMQIGVYPVDEDSWIDVGQWKEYQKSLEKL